MTWPLPIFPEGSLSESVVTTVWIGVMVVAFFNLRFGWVLSGLVVPGYLVPLLLLRPVSVVVVILEALLTYGIVRLLSRYGRSSDRWCSFFGRDRFFALVLVSVLVRAICDGYVLPAVGRYGLQTGAWDIEFESHLHSFGLIVISLVANQLWKPGMVRGLTSFGVTLAVTFILVRYVLMTCTNLSLGSLAFMYEDMSASILASPKAYIVLLVSAYIASKLNQHYSWDFNGILLPSLLALQWYDPLRILASFAEAWIVLIAGSLLLRCRVFEGVTIEGARKLLLFFNLSFAYKMLLGHAVALWHLPVSAVDCYGFGYLLPTLLAIKMHDRQSAARVTRTTLQASLTGLAAASVVGFTLVLTPESWLLVQPRELQRVALSSPPVTFLEQVRRDKIELYGARLRQQLTPPDEGMLRSFEVGLRHLRSHLETGKRSTLELAASFLEQADHEILQLDDHHLYLRDDSGLSWGVYVFNTHSPQGLVLEVPAALREWATFESALYLSEELGASATAVSFRGRSTRDFTPNDSLVAYRTFFNIFHRVFRDRGVLQVRGYSTKGLQSLGEADPPLQPTPAESHLWVSRKLPAALSLRALKSSLGELGSVEWSQPQFENIQRETSFRGFGELFLSRSDRRRLLGRFFAGYAELTVRPEVRKIDGYLQKWIFDTKGFIAPRGANSYEVPRLESLLLLAEEVVQPLLSLARAQRQIDIGDADVLDKVRTINIAASLFGYGVTLYIHKETGNQYFILKEVVAPEQDILRPLRHWGLYVFRIGHRCDPYIVQIPRPLYERNTFEYGVTLFDNLNASALMIAGAHPRCNLDGSADVIRPHNKVSLFQLVHQICCKELHVNAGAVIQVRAFGHKPGVALPPSDLLLAAGEGLLSANTMTPLGHDLLSQVEVSGLSYQLVDGDPLTAGYEPYGTLQAQHLREASQREFYTLWLSPLARFGFRRLTEARDEDSLMLALGIPTREFSLYELLAGSDFLDPNDVPKQLVSELTLFQETQNVNSLATIRRLWPTFAPTRIVDPATRKSFLVFECLGQRLPLVATLSLRPTALSEKRIANDFDRASLAEFSDSNSSLLWIGEESL